MAIAAESPVAASAHRSTAHGALVTFYWMNGLTSFATTILTVGIFFFLKSRFHWGLGRNFQVAAGMGVTYVTGSLLAGWLASRRGAMQSLVWVYAALALLTGATAGVLAWSPNPAPAVVASLLAYSFLNALGWPMLEGLVAQGATAVDLSRRIALYNALWSGTGAIALAANGFLIAHLPVGVFLLPSLLHGGCAITLALAVRSAGRFQPSTAVHGHPPAEPELERLRQLALWLSRIALPATYIVIYALSAMMPSLPVLRTLDVTAATLVGSVWLFARWLTFIGLGMAVWWHTRPRALLVGSFLMLIAFIAMTFQPTSHGFGNLSTDLLWMIAWQIILGAMIGLIYFASLYFGMVLSHGSTEHGGYHEALIGLGQILGPLAGAVAEAARPGQVNLSVAAVATLVGLSVASASVASLVLRKGERDVGRS